MPSDVHISLESLAGRPLDERVTYLISLMRPAVQSDGGDLEFVSVSDDGEVLVRLHGACVGCPSSSMTLQNGIERSLREYLPEVTSVRAID